MVQDGPVPLLAPDTAAYPDLADLTAKFCHQGAPGFGSWDKSALTLAVCPGATVDVHATTPWGFALGIENPGFEMKSPPLIVSAAGFVTFGHQLADKPGEVCPYINIYKHVYMYISIYV